MLDIVIPYASPRCWKAADAPGDICSGDFEVPSHGSMLALAAFFPARAGIDLPLEGGLWVMHDPKLRIYDPSPLVEPGIGLVRVADSGSGPPILFLDDRTGLVRAPRGAVAMEYDYEDAPHELLYAGTPTEPELVTKIGGFPCIIQGAEQLVAPCTRCGATCTFILQLVGNEAIGLGDGTLYVFMCPKGCELRSKFQR